MNDFCRRREHLIYNTRVCARGESKACRKAYYYAYSLSLRIFFTAACLPCFFAKAILYCVCLEPSERRWWQLTGILSECHAPFTNRPQKVYWAFKENHRQVASVASQQAYAIIFGFIYEFEVLTIIQNENPNEKCATVRCFEEGILKGSGFRPRHPN